jgi:hypothetical protein
MYLGCLGLLLFSHETLAVTLQGALLAYFLYRAVRYVETPGLRNAVLVGLSLGALTLTRGWVTPVTLSLALYLCTRFLAHAARRSCATWLVVAAVALLIVAAWVVPAALLRPLGAAPVANWLVWN